MALTARQAILYQDRFWCYRRNPAADRDNTGTIPKYAAVSGIQNKPCKIFTTTNYSESISPAGLQNQDNFLTADRLHFERSLDVQDADIVKITRQDGSTEWFVVGGNAYSRFRSNKASVLLRNTNAPTGI